MNGCELKPIPGFSGYFVTKNGEIFSNKKGSLVKMKTFLDGKNTTS